MGRAQAQSQLLWAPRQGAPEWRDLELAPTDLGILLEAASEVEAWAAPLAKRRARADDVARLRMPAEVAMMQRHHRVLLLLLVVVGMCLAPHELARLEL